MENEGYETQVKSPDGALYFSSLNLFLKDYAIQQQPS
jgi:hypothetical protein